MEICFRFVVLLVATVLFCGCKERSETPSKAPGPETTRPNSKNAPGESPSLAMRDGQEIYEHLGYEKIYVFDWVGGLPTVDSSDVQLSEKANETLREFAKMGNYESGEILLAIPSINSEMTGRIVLSISLERSRLSRTLSFNFDSNDLERSGYSNTVSEQYEPEIDVEKQWCIGHQIRWGGDPGDPNWVFTVFQVGSRDQPDEKHGG